MMRWAAFSDCRSYRYSLVQGWETVPGSDWLVVVGLNPSTADEINDDPTVRRCIGFAKRERYVGLIMLNAFAFRGTDPKSMLAAADPVGPGNDAAIRVLCESRDVLLAWGVHGGHRGRDCEVVGIVRPVASRVLCLGLTAAGYPRHPLYLARDTPMVRYSGRWAEQIGNFAKRPLESPDRFAKL